MPDWRLAGPAWTPPDDRDDSDHRDDYDDDYAPPREAPEQPIPAQREKKRGLFGRKRAAKAEPPPAPAPAPSPAAQMAPPPPPPRDEPVSPPAPSVADVRPTSPQPQPAAPQPAAPHQKETRGRGKKAKRDEEYVDWVAGLSAPEPEERPRDTTPRRSLRSGRHSTDTE
jgi:hypothetical protein